MKGRKISWSETNFSQTVWVEKVAELPFKITEDFDCFYTVSTISEKVVMYLAKDTSYKKEVCVYFPNGKFYSGCGKTFAEAIKNGIKDAIWYV